MHTNYYFLRQLAPALKSALVSTPDVTNTSTASLRFMECYSQDRDEVVLVFAEARGKINYYKPFYVKATLRPDFSGLLFPESVRRARTNSVNLFESVAGPAGQERAVVDVRSFLNERCLAITLADGFSLLFKFFGNRPNLLAFHNDTVVDLFNRQLVSDETLHLSAFDRPINQSYEAAERVNFDYKKLFPTFGKMVNEWLEERFLRYEALDNQAKWTIIQDALRYLNHPRYYLSRYHYKPVLSLLPIDEQIGNLTDGSPVQVFDDPIEAANRFYGAYNGLTLFDLEKAGYVRLLDKRRKRLTAQIDVTLQRLIAHEESISYEEMGHILMANLHNIPVSPGSKSPERVTLADFYRDVPITLTLKPDLSPQKNAENFYRKAKNEKIEEEHAGALMTAREAELAQIDQYQTDVTNVATLKELRRFIKQHPLSAADSERGSPATESGSLFKEVAIDSFRILIGRNAKNNDLLTQQYAYKDDLWLHARDVSGSHVLVKYQAGKPFPRNVIERAAELAAWYSKRRTDSLCPVTVTPKKFVRKPKGLAAGQVIVEKEDVVLVVPRGE